MLQSFFPWRMYRFHLLYRLDERLDLVRLDRIFIHTIIYIHTNYIYIIYIFSILIHSWTQKNWLPPGRLRMWASRTLWAACSWPALTWRTNWRRRHGEMVIPWYFQEFRFAPSGFLVGLHLLRFLKHIGPFWCNDLPMIWMVMFYGHAKLQESQEGTGTPKSTSKTLVSCRLLLLYRVDQMISQKRA